MTARARAVHKQKDPLSQIDQAYDLVMTAISAAESDVDLLEEMRWRTEFIADCVEKALRKRLRLSLTKQHFEEKTHDKRTCKVCALARVAI